MFTSIATVSISTALIDKSPLHLNFSGSRHLLAAVFLFSGPILQKIKSRDMFYPFDLRFLRNYVVGPIVEEIVFRCCMSELLLYSKYQKPFIIIFTSLLFGIAHIHHHIVFPNALFAIVQFGYTFLFGLFASFVYLDSPDERSFLIPVFIHAFCNYMELPDFESAIRDFVERKYSKILFIQSDSTLLSVWSILLSIGHLPFLNQQSRLAV